MKRPRLAGVDGPEPLGGRGTSRLLMQGRSYAPMGMNPGHVVAVLAIFGTSNSSLGPEKGCGAVITDGAEFVGTL
jgi:hypothetical protein